MRISDWSSDVCSSDLWTYAKYLLGHERTGIAAVGRSKAQLRRLKSIARREMSGDRPLIEDADFAGRLARIELDLLSLESLVLRVLPDEIGRASCRERVCPQM